MIMQWTRVAPAELERILEMDGDEFFGWYEEHIDDFVDADKAWHAVHAVLTDSSWGTQHDLSSVVLGGTEFGEDTGYGKPRYLTAPEVDALVARLGPIPVEQFERHIDLGRLAALEIYPDIWDRAEERSINIDYVRDGYAAVRAQFFAAQQSGEAMLIICT
jgi:hypothetical protein